MKTLPVKPVVVALVLLFALVASMVVSISPSAARRPEPRDASDLPARTPAWRPTWVQVVVSRYAEDVSWLHKLPFTDILVYDKFDKLDRPPPDDDEEEDGTPAPTPTPQPRHGDPPKYAKVVRVANVGRCDHTYLYHILRNWDRLADVTIFVPGSCASSKTKWHKLQWIVSQVGRTADSAFPLDLVTEAPVGEALGDFKLDTYVASHPHNAAINPESSLQLCKHRPYGVFYRACFPELPPVREVVYHGVFAVSRQHIQQQPRSRYAKLLSYLDTHSNPEAGHYMERSWLAAFYPVPTRCMSVPSDWDETFGKNVLACAAVVALVCLGMYTKAQ